MGRKSVREDKNIYQISREELGLTREQAAELLVYISADRIEKIESGKSAPRPEEVETMAAAYRKPALTNYYCANECPIGRRTVPQLELKELSQITLEVLATLNSLNKEKDRLVEITVDGVITEDERKDFEAIRAMLKEMNISINSLSLWVDNAVNSGKLQ